MRYILLCLLMCMWYASVGQTVRVVDKSTADPIEFAVITSVNASDVVLTDINGEADISIFKQSELMEFRQLGYESVFISYDSLMKLEFVIDLIPAINKLEEVVVSVTRWGRTPRKSPAHVARISQADVELFNPQTAADLLNTSGEVFIQKSQQGGGSPMIRGFSTNRLLYAVDGVRMNTAIFRGGNLHNVIALDPFTISQTEVTYGPGSVVYGSDAIGAVMAFETKTPELSAMDKLDFSGQIDIRYASANEEELLHADFSLAGKKWGLLSSYTIDNFGHLKMGKHGPDEYLRPFYVSTILSNNEILENRDPRVQIPTAYRQDNFMQKVRYRPNDKWNFEYGYQWSDALRIPRYDRHIRLRNGQPVVAEWSYTPNTWDKHQLHVANTKTVSMYDGLDVRIARQKFVEGRRTRDFNDPILTDREEEVIAWSVNVDASKTFGQHTFLYGVEWVTNDVESKASFFNVDTFERGITSTRYPDANWSSYGVYMDWQNQISKQLLIEAGLRYNQISLKADFTKNLEFFPLPFDKAEFKKGSVIGSLGAVYRPKDTWLLAANISTGFRAPNVDDIGKIFDSAPGSVVVPNDDIKPEYAYHFEVGVSHVIARKFKIDVNGYYTLLDDALIRRNFTLNGADSIMYDGVLSQVQAIQNASKTTVLGAQFGVDVTFGRGLKFESVVNIQKGEEEDDQGVVTPSRHASPWFGRSILTYKKDKWRIALSGVYSGGFDFDELPVTEADKPYLYAIDDEGRPYSPSWYTLNLNGNLMISNAINLGIGLENITNQRYKTYSSGIAAAGFNVLVHLKFSF